MHLLQHTFFWIFFGFGFYEEKKKLKNPKKSGPEEAKNFSRGGEKVEEKSPRKDSITF